MLFPEKLRIRENSRIPGAGNSSAWYCTIQGTVHYRVLYTTGYCTLQGNVHYKVLYTSGFLFLFVVQQPISSLSAEQTTISTICCHIIYVYSAVWIILLITISQKGLQKHPLMDEKQYYLVKNSRLFWLKYYGIDTKDTKGTQGTVHYRIQYNTEYYTPQDNVPYRILHTTGYCIL